MTQPRPKHRQRTTLFAAALAVAALGCGDASENEAASGANEVLNNETPGNEALGNQALGNEALVGNQASGGSTPTTQVRRGWIEALVTASGSVIAPRLTELGPEVRGRLSAVHFDVGDNVAAGDVVFQLDPAPFKTDLQRALAGLEVAQAEAAQASQEVERMRRLAEQQVAPPQQLEQRLTLLAVAKARVEQELAAVESAEQNLVRTKVTSPYAAHVVERQLHEGAIVGPGAVVVTIQERTGFAAELDVPAAAAAPVGVGDPVLLIVEGATEPGPSAIASVNARIDPETRTYRVRASVPPAVEGAKAGAFVRAEIRPRTRDGTLIVERDAVLERDGRTYLFATDENGRAQQVEVTIGVIGADMVEIRTGAAAGDAVIVGPLIDRLADGVPIDAAELAERAASGDDAPSVAPQEETPQ